MPTDVTFESFEKELNRLVESFGKRLAELKQPSYAEAQLRDDFLNPFFRALGWDMENRAGFIQKEREVEIESATQIGGGRKRADYLFRTDKRDRFVCEAKKPAEELHSRYAFQAKRYAWNKGVPMALLTDFEELKIYIVGGKPHIDEPQVGEWKSWHFRQYPLIARELWDLLARDKIASGSIDAALDALPKKATGTGKARQQWLIKPDRNRALDNDFLEFLDETRRDLASDIYKNNDHDELLEGNKLTEAVQRIIDRILFLRICEDRDIDTGTTLQSIVETWRKNTGNDDTGRRAHQQPLEMREEPPADYGSSGIRAPKDSLWRYVVRHFRALDRRPPTHVPFFNGNLFKPHFTETLIISDEWLAGFIGELSADESPYLFSEIAVEILGSVYERFLGKVVRPQGRGITIEEKPEVRKAGGVYYTPRYIVDYIVEQTAGKLLDEIAGVASGLRPDKSAHSADATTLKDFEKRTAALRLLDPACGSGSFLIRAFERVCEHWERWLKSQLPAKTKKTTDVDWEKIAQAPVGTKPEAPAKDARSEWLKRNRKLCWLDESTGDLHLTIHLKRLILTNNIYGVDLDSAAVEVTQLSLYLKMLEHENRTTLQRQRELLSDEAEIALLPPLQDNIKCGNSLIASDFSELSEELLRVHAFDWNVGFKSIMRAGGFDAVIGNPPYRMLQPHNTDEKELEYLKANYVAAEFKIELFHLFMQRGVSLLKNDGFHGHIVPTTLLNNVYAESLRRWLMERCSIQHISVAQGRVFEDADVHTSVLIFKSERDAKIRAEHEVLTTSSLSPEFAAAPSDFSRTKQKRFLALPGATWNILLNEENAPLLQKLNSECVPLEKVSKINRGLITGDREKYFATKKLTAMHQPILAGADVHRYATNPSSEFVLFERPKTSGGCWDADVHLARHKIVIRQIGIAPTASIISEPIAVTGNIFTVRSGSLEEEKYLLAVINSKLTAYFWRIMFADFKTSFPQVTIFSLSQVPVRIVSFKKPADKARHDKLVVLVDKLLGLMPKLRAATADSEKAVLQNAVTATDQQIDALVYELYNLTPEEIKLVESNA